MRGGSKINVDALNFLLGNSASDVTSETALSEDIPQRLSRTMPASNSPRKKI